MKENPVKTRLALDGEGSLVATLAAHSGFCFKGWDIDWSRVHPHWLIAEYEGRPIGTINVCLGRPVTRLEIMGIDPEVSQRIRGCTALALTDAGSVIARQYGAEAISGLIPFDNPSYKRVALRRGWIVLDSGNLLLRRV